MKHLRVSLIVLLLAASATHASSPSLLYLSEGNRLRRLDIDTIKNPPLLDDILIERASLDPDGRDINGQICLVPDGSGRFIAGEDTGQPHPPAGWGVFEQDGTQVGKLTATYFVAGAEPHGCAFNPDGNLFTAEVGEQGFGTPSGQLIMWFPPFDRFPGPPDSYPNTDEESTNFCKIATDIGTAGAIAVDSQARVYVASSSLLSIYRFSPPFPTGPDGAGGCGSADALGSPMADVVNRETFVSAIGLSTFSGLAFAPNGNLYAASVLTGEIFEFDTDGNLVRMILDPPDLILPIPTGAPQDIAVGQDGTLYYADLNLVGTLPYVGPGPNGKVWQLRFDEFDDPLPPEIIKENLAFPDGLGVLPGNLSPIDHFKCYKAKDLKNPKFVSTTVGLSDQFGVNDGPFEVKKPFLMCNPTDKNGEGIDNPDDHLICYKIKGPKLDKNDRPQVEVVNQLGTVQLEAKKPFLLCVPSAKTVLP